MTPRRALVPARAPEIPREDALAGAACADMDQNRWDEVFFPPSAPDAKNDAARFAAALTYCNRCPVASACLEKALEVERGNAVSYRHGMYGGATPRERYAEHRYRVRMEKKAREEADSVQKFAMVWPVPGGETVSQEEKAELLAEARQVFVIRLYDEGLVAQEHPRWEFVQTAVCAETKDLATFEDTPLTLRMWATVAPSAASQ